MESRRHAGIGEVLIVNDIVDGLAALVGRDNVAADPASLEEYAQDESFAPRLTPWAVVRPGSAEEVQQVVAWANETVTPLVPVSSGGPHFHGDTVPSVPGAVMLDLRRMDKVLRVDRRNRMVVIEPGVTYPQLQAALAEQGMRVTPPLCPRANKSVVASLLERQPTLIPRYNFHLPEPLRSCGVVWGNGDVMFTGEAGTGPLSLEAQWEGGLVQADPKGPGQTDFFRLLTGAQGTFGVVTWAAVRCELVPTAHEYLFAAADELDDLVDFTYRIDRIRLGDEVLVLNDAYLTRLLEASGAAVDADALPAWTLVLGLGGREHFAAERVEVQKKDALEMAAEFGLTLAPAVAGAATDDIAAVLAGTCDAPWELAAEGACADVFFVTTLEEAPAFVEMARIVADGHGYAAEDVGVYIQPQHQGVTHHVELSLPYQAGDADTRAGMRELAADLAANLIAAGAYFSRPYGAWAQPVYNRDAAARDALRKVKPIFDPAGILNPGKLCFGAPKTQPALVASEV
jgi:FAD/FMN-containing dehydrogenase